MKRLLAMALLVLALVWFDAAFMEHNALVWYLPQEEGGGVFSKIWLNNTDCLLVTQNEAEDDERGRYQMVYDFYLQSGSQPPRLVGSLPVGGFMRHCNVFPLREGIMLDIHRWENELWFYDERSQTLQRSFDGADRPEPSGLLREYDYFEDYWLGHSLYLIERALEDGTADHKRIHYLSLYDSRTGQEQPLAELREKWDSSLFVPGAYQGAQAGRGRWLAMNYLGELLEVTLPEGGLAAEARLWQAAGEWPMPGQDKDSWYFHLLQVPGRAGDCWLLEEMLPGSQKVAYRVVDLKSGGLVGCLEVPYTQEEHYNLLDAYGSKLYLAQPPEPESIWGNKIWAYDYITGERQLIWQDNLTWWRRKLLGNAWGADYIRDGTISPDGRELVFCSAYDYVRRLPLPQE